MAKDTAIYGLSSIVARFVNYLLVPIQTAKFAASGGEYGVITNVYAYVAILIIMLTFGMETTFFRFMSKEGENPQRIYSTTLRMVGMVAAVSTVLVLIFCKPIASWVGYADHPEYVGVMYTTVAIDAFTCILFDELRCTHQPIKFATLKIANIVLNILLNVVYFFVLPALHLNPFGMYGDQFHYDVVWVLLFGQCAVLVQRIGWHPFWIRHQSLPSYVGLCLANPCHGVGGSAQSVCLADSLSLFL